MDVLKYMLAEMSVKIDLLTTNAQTSNAQIVAILTGLNGQGQTDIDDLAGLSFPISSIENLKGLEKKLEDPSIRCKMVNIILA